MTKLPGKVAIISRSGCGSRRALAHKLASEGPSIVVKDLDDAAANDVVTEIEAAGGQAVAWIGDVTAEGFGEHFVAGALDRFGGLDVIVKKAGYSRKAVIKKQTDEHLQAIFDVHDTTPFRILRAETESWRTMPNGMQ